MLFFDGTERTCLKFSKRKGGVLRCDKFKSKGEKGFTKFPCKPKGLKGGGRSQWAIRGGKTACSSAVSVKKKRKPKKR